MRKFEYLTIPILSREEVELAISKNDIDKLRVAILSVALYEADLKFAENICVVCSKHEDPGVRGNAILGFGHIARIHRKLDEGKTKLLIEEALQDADAYVREHAESAADDVELFLSWKLNRPKS